MLLLIIFRGYTFSPIRLTFRHFDKLLRYLGVLTSAATCKHNSISNNVSSIDACSQLIQVVCRQGNENSVTPVLIHFNNRSAFFPHSCLFFLLSPDYERSLSTFYQARRKFRGHQLLSISTSRLMSERICFTTALFQCIINAQ